jgi:hypothetical protein
MSVVGAIVSRYNLDTDSDATALRDTVGVGKCWDGVPENKAMPYISVDDVASTLVAETKGQTTRLEEATVQFDVWDTTRASVESILNLVDDCYVGHALTISNRSLLSTHVVGRHCEKEKRRLWHGILDLLVVVEKSS